MPLVFPGSDQSIEDRDPNEFVFRDGKRTVAPYLAALMGQIDTERLTFDDAIRAVNTGLMTDHLNRAFDGVMASHKKTWGG